MSMRNLAVSPSYDCTRKYLIPGGCFVFLQLLQGHTTYQLSPIKPRVPSQLEQNRLLDLPQSQF